MRKTGATKQPKNASDTAVYVSNLGIEHIFVGILAHLVSG